MAEIYSNPAGPTPQAASLQSLGGAMSSITGNPALASYTGMAQGYQPYMSNVKQNLTQTSGLPGLATNYADQSKLLDLFAHDQTLAQKYGQGQNITPSAQPPTLSKESLASGFQGELGSIDPSTLVGLMAGSTKGKGNMLDLIKNAIDFQADRVTKQTQADADAYKSVMDAYATLADQYTKEQQIQAQYGLGGSGTDLSDISSLDKASQAKKLRDAYDSSTSDVEKKRISALAKQYNIKLAPDTLTQAELGYVDTSATLLSTINDALNSLENVPDSELGIAIGSIPQFLVGKQATSGLLKGDYGNLGRKLLILQGMGDRKIMGGRLIRDLVTRFGGAFPGLNHSKDEIRKFLTDMKTQAINTINAEAKNRGYYGGSQELLDTFGYGQIGTDTSSNTRPPLSSFEQ
jgi:hypothetical protein